MCPAGCAFCQQGQTPNMGCVTGPQPTGLSVPGSLRPALAVEATGASPGRACAVPSCALFQQNKAKTTALSDEG